jgi:hypothetical protein
MTTVNIHNKTKLGLQEILLIWKLQCLIRWNIVLFIQIYGKLSKLLQTGQKPCHSFVKSGAPEQIHGTKPGHQQSGFIAKHDKFALPI